MTATKTPLRSSTTSKSTKSSQAYPTTIHLTGGVDVGNGYVKAVLRNTDTNQIDTVDLPSAVVSTSRAHPKVPLADDLASSLTSRDEAAGSTTELYNSLDASFVSPTVAAADRRIFGRAALSVRGSKFTEFEVLGKHSKADQELAKVLVLGVFATKALGDYVQAAGSLPTAELTVHVRAGLALPISEFVARRHTYAAEFTGSGSSPSVHLVTVKNFSTPVSLRLIFDDVQVIAEGASAQFAITDKGEVLADALLADLRSRDADAVPGITGADLVAVRNTIGVDVGEGTVNFPVFTHGAFNAEASATLEEGFGTALLNAAERMAEASPPLEFASRKQLADFLAHAPSPLQRARHNRATGYVEEEAGYLVDQIASAFGDVLAQAGATTEVVYVYGGGSGPIKHLLDPALRKVGGEVPVLYLDASYSRHLNREGLYIAARHVESASR